MSMGAALDKHKKAGPPSLTGSDVNSDVTKITVIGVEETNPEFNSPIKITFKPQMQSVDPKRGKIDTFYPNKSSVKSLIKMYGDDERNLIGETLKLVRIPRVNPTTGENTFGLQVMEFVTEKTKPITKKKGK